MGCMIALNMFIQMSPKPNYDSFIYLTFCWCPPICLCPFFLFRSSVYWLLPQQPTWRVFLHVRVSVTPLGAAQSWQGVRCFLGPQCEFGPQVSGKWKLYLCVISTVILQQTDYPVESRACPSMCVERRRAVMLTEFPLH